MPAWNKIIDANGQQVGKLISIPYVEISIGGKSYIVNVGRTSITGFSLPPSNLRTTIDCTGPGYTDAAQEPHDLVPLAYVAEPGWTIYDRDPSFPPTPLTIRSAGTEDNCSYDPEHPNEITAIKLIPVLNLASLYQAPFTLA